MRYIVYLDRLFLMQTIQTLVLLGLTGIFQTGQIFCDRKHCLRMLLGAGMESFMFCGIFLLPGWNGWVKSLLLAGLTQILLIFVFRIRSLPQLGKVLLFYNGSAFLLGGAFYAVMGMTGSSSSFHTIPTAAGMIFFTGLVLCLWKWETAEKEKTLAVVELLDGNVRIVTCALIDSGNTLYDPVSTKPVCVVERGILQERIPLMQPERFRIVPYHTLGGRGIMQVIQIDSLMIKKEEQEITVEKPLLGLYDGEITTNGDYRMILHTGYLKKGDKLLRGSGKEEKRK